MEYRTRRLHREGSEDDLAKILFEAAGTRLTVALD